jgi:hypothetical protein
MQLYVIQEMQHIKQTMPEAAEPLVDYFDRTYVSGRLRQRHNSIMKIKKKYRQSDIVGKVVDCRLLSWVKHHLCRVPVVSEVPLFYVGHKLFLKHACRYRILVCNLLSFKLKKVTDYSTMEVIATKRGRQKLCFEGFMHTQKKIKQQTN